jgi:hypothetical protein
VLSGPPPTATEIREVIEEILAGATTGRDPIVIACNGFDADEVLAALQAVRDAAPDPPAEVLEAARESISQPRPMTR